MDVQKIVSQMTLEEKAGMLSGLDFWHTKPVERLGVPSVMVSDGPHGLRKQDDQGDHLGINDSIKAVCFPAGCATAASFDRDALRQIGEAIGDSCQHEKVSVVLGPAVNIKRSPLCGRNFEYYSEDPYLAGEAAVSLIDGVQSRNVGTSIKHFALNSQEHRRMSSDSRADERTMREIYLPAFEAAVKRANPWTVMCSYNKLGGAYASENRKLLTELLRDDWGFKGLVMSDWGAVNNRVEGVKAGLDLEMPGSNGTNDEKIVRAVREGKLDEKLVDLCVTRMLELIDRYTAHAKPETPWDKDAQHVLARKIGAECMVLLKNEQGLLPLSKQGKLAVIGAFAKQPRVQGGGSSHINCQAMTTPMDALPDTLNVVYAAGYPLEQNEPDEALLQEAERAAREADVAVIFAGLPDSFESEGYDRTHLNLPECQNELIRRVAKANAKTVVVLSNGSPVVMPWLNEVGAVLEAYLCGEAAGGAMIDVLFGDVNPCGRLPETFPLKLEDTSAFPWYGGEKDVVEYREGVFVGYRWYDKKGMQVLFPFGYGLSYTTFAYSNLALSAESIRDTDPLTVSVDVTNTGKVAGKEVVQLYVADRESTVIRPVRELKGFDKVLLQPGETKTVRFTLDKRAFAFWDSDLHDWRVESGAFGIQIGASSREIVLEKDVTVAAAPPAEHFTADSIFMDLMASPRAMTVLEPLFDQINNTFGVNDDDSETAMEAVSPDMIKAMMGYMPLHALASFSGQKVPDGMLDALLEQLNAPEK